MSTDQCRCEPSYGYTCAACSPAGQLARAQDRLLKIAALVNGYANGATKGSADETLQAIAEALGDPF